MELFETLLLHFSDWNEVLKIKMLQYVKYKTNIQWKIM
jgi:hypothetical protein